MHCPTLVKMRGGSSVRDVNGRYFSSHPQSAFLMHVFAVPRPCPRGAAFNTDLKRLVPTLQFRVRSFPCGVGARC